MDKINKELQELADTGKLRELSSSAGGIDFTSNDYLGFRHHPALRQSAIEALENGLEIGAGGSRLLRGNHPAHESLESHAAQFFGHEAALFFANGFLANMALMSTLPARGDMILFDSLIHASLRFGIQTNHAKHMRMPHNNVNAMGDMLRKFSSSGHRCWVVAESVYSMDGDIAPLQDLVKLCAQHDAWLVVDEAHATGVFGPQGRGMTHNICYDKLIAVHTCGKALGVAGGLVCAKKPVIDLLIARARQFIYSTAPLPLQAVLVERALKLCAEEDIRREKLFSLCAFARNTFGVNSPSPIFPILIGDDRLSVERSAYLQEQGFDVRSIRPPTVPEGTARLRIAIHAVHEEAQIAALGRALQSSTTRAAA
jgi:8-amino-7-oxononanoate synthase